MNPQGSGTIVYPSRSLPSTPNPSKIDISLQQNGYYGNATAKYRRTPTALTNKSTTIINIRSHGTSSPQAFLTSVGHVLQDYDIDIDLLSSSQQTLSLAVNTRRLTSLDDAVMALEKFGIVQVTKGMAIISVVGHRMRNMVGVAAEIFAALASASINIDLISQGASEINIS